MLSCHPNQQIRQSVVHLHDGLLNFSLAYVPPPEDSLGGASSVSADGDSSVGGGTGAGASALVGTYVPAAKHYNSIATVDCHCIAAMMTYCDCSACSDSQCHVQQVQQMAHDACMVCAQGLMTEQACCCMTFSCEALSGFDKQKGKQKILTPGCVGAIIAHVQRCIRPNALPCCSIRSRREWTSSSSARILWCSSAASRAPVFCEVASSSL